MAVQGATSENLMGIWFGFGYSLEFTISMPDSQLDACRWQQFIHIDFVDKSMIEEWALGVTMDGRSLITTAATITLIVTINQCDLQLFL